MALYAVLYRYVDDQEFVQQHRPAHREFIRGLVGTCGLIVSGRADGGDQPSGLLVFDAESQKDLEGILDDDPFWIEGIIEKREIFEWSIAAGTLGEHRAV